jgi:hypothetical protein
MSKLLSLVSLQILMSVSTLVWADVLNLTDGTILEGELVGRDSGIVMFRVNGEIRAFPESQVRALVTEDNSSGAATGGNAAIPVFTVPAGTRLVLSMLEDVNTSRHSEGHRFRAQLESALVVNGVTVAGRGTVVHGVLTSASQSRRASGKSEMAMEFRDILLNDQLFPIATGELSSQGGNETGRTARRVLGAAALGGLINGSSGARVGAAVGATASILTKGESINVPRGTILETTLRVPLDIRQ